MHVMWTICIIIHKLYIEIQKWFIRHDECCYHICIKTFWLVSHMIWQQIPFNLINITLLNKYEYYSKINGIFWRRKNHSKLGRILAERFIQFALLVDDGTVNTDLFLLKSVTSFYWSYLSDQISFASSFSFGFVFFFFCSECAIF